MPWTEQQQNAIDARGSSIIVSAAAGSGKTAVLTERLVKLIADPESNISADRIVVVTFTNDAASELRKRLDMKLRALIEKNPENSYLLKQQALLQNAKISTINSFCFELLRDNITDQGITSGFSVLDENDDSVIKSQAMEELLDYYSSKEYEKISYLYDRFCIKDHSALVSIINKTDKFLSSVAMSDKWLDTAVFEYKKDFCDSIYFSTLFDWLLTKFHYAAQLAEDNLAMIKEIFPDMKMKEAEKSLAQAHEDCIIVEDAIMMAEKRRFPNEQEITYFTKFPDLVRVGKKVVHNIAKREVYKVRRNKIKDILKAAVSSLNSAENDFAETGEVVEILAEVVRKYRSLVWERKCERNSISFDDGERLALELLADIDENGNLKQSEIAERLSEYYSIIMIDEYQDSNNKQDMIFKLLSKNYRQSDCGEPEYGDNAFLVGDVKQSIYQFRLANPKNFIDVMKSCAPYGDADKIGNKYILLNKNFRSSHEVIDFVNYIFSQIMSENCGDINYNEDEMLYYGAECFSAPHEESRKTVISFINTDPLTDDDDEGEAVEAPEAEYTAAKIADMIKNKVPVTESDGSVRPCMASDFCILVRKNYYTKAYVKALENRGISAKGSDEKGYLKSQEIAILIDLLRIIENPLRDIPMAAVMVSPMYGFTVEELAYIKSYGRKDNLYGIMLSAVRGEISGFDQKIAVKIDSFLENIDRFRLDSVTMTIGELIGSIYDRTDFISVMQLTQDGEKKRANLRMLIQYAQNYESFAAAEGCGGLGGFLRHIDRISESGDYNQGKVSASSGDYVSVQTLHKSKGLEYPFVFICETSSKFKFNYDQIMCSDDGRIGFVLCDKELLRKYKTFQRNMLTEERKMDSRSEEMRLLYVGMTRAKQQLFINLKCGGKSLERTEKLIEECVVNNSGISELTAAADSFSDWLWLCLMIHGSFIEIAEKLGIESETFGFPAASCNDDLFEWSYVSMEKLTDVKLEEEEVAAQADSKLVNELLEIIGNDYDRTLSETAAKLSVTQISRKFRDDENFDFHLKRPKFISEKSRQTGAERGTAIHTFFQYCDFDNAIKNTVEETERLRTHGFLTKAQAECIEPQKIMAFFNSELYDRIKKSKGYVREKKFTVAAAQLEIDDPVFRRLKNSDGMIKGIIDLMYEEEDGIVIVDYKSDRGANEAKLRERYAKQMEIYKAAIELTTEKKVKGLILYSIEMEKEIVLE